MLVGVTSLSLLAIAAAFPTSPTSPTSPSSPDNEPRQAGTEPPLKALRRRSESSHRFLAHLVALRRKYGFLFEGGDNELDKRWETGVTNVYRDLSYSVPIEIGTPPQTINVTLDTGSTTLWVYTSCDGNVCADVTPYQPASSSSFKTTNAPFQQKYGVGGVNGTLGNDVVAIAGNQVPNQQIGLVTHEDNDGVGALRGSTKSGLLGLGWPSGGGQGADGLDEDPRSWWATSVGSTSWPEPQFGIHLARQLDHDSSDVEIAGGTLSLGGVDSQFYTGSINYITAARDSSVYWQVPVDGAVVNGKAISAVNANGTKPLAIVDTGTTVVLGGRATVAAIYAQIPGSSIDTSVSFAMLGHNADIYTFPCAAISSLPAISITLGGVNYPIYAPDLAIAIEGETCTGAILGLDSPNDMWLLGDTFLKNVYSVYRYNPPSVGFAPVSPDHDAHYTSDDISNLYGQNKIYFDKNPNKEADAPKADSEFSSLVHVATAAAVEASSAVLSKNTTALPQTTAHAHSTKQSGTTARFNSAAAAVLALCGSILALQA